MAAVVPNRTHMMPRRLSGIVVMMASRGRNSKRSGGVYDNLRCLVESASLPLPRRKGSHAEWTWQELTVIPGVRVPKE